MAGAKHVCISCSCHSFCTFKKKIVHFNFSNLCNNHLFLNHLVTAEEPPVVHVPLVGNYCCNSCMCLCSSQERQRLETILSLCSELGRTERDGGGAATSPTSAVADLQKINQELEKLQLNDDDDDTPSVFSDSSAGNGMTGHMTSPGSENGYHDDDLQVRRRRSSGTRDNRAESPAISLRSFAPSPSPRTQRTNEV